MDKSPTKRCFLVNRVHKVFKDYCYTGFLNNKECIFKIDTGSDVSLINRKFVREGERRFPVFGRRFKYPTGEDVMVDFEILAKVELGKNSFELPILVSDIADDCLLGMDFLRKTDFGRVCDSFFGAPSVIRRIAQTEDSKEFSPLLEELLSKNSKNLSDNQQNVFVEFIREYRDVFSEKIVAGNCDVVRHVINVVDSLPIKQVPRRIPFNMRKEVNEIIEEMKEQGVIEASQSPWISPAVLVKKKDGSIRFCVDYRKLNDVTMKDSFPLPRIDDILDQLAGNTWFSTLDLKSGYWQVKIHPEDREKTAFFIGNGLWQFTVMPFGLCNAPATFQRLMEKVLHGLLFKICLVYLDDVIIFGKNFNEMVENLKKVFLRLLI